ncbi:dethiobiotin synthase [Streptomyces tateyamensis]|uniref:ATP-dependent dethiobiotin synthetase BioD n=1 Tax=Streptomyces tateyamensis TaxID=565073 RepID=A0A2V4NHM9_9ACTN|nr:dethiobiotin synthase [Streptomyces tateyamensis]PYC64792.1 dethiobiotin synthase [Streptomyces tateyamensis]
MSELLFVSGTGTEVGKTAVTAALAALAVRAGRSVAVLKPGQTGMAPGEAGDAAEVARLAGPAVTVRELARYPEPLAPDRAALRSGLPFLTMDQVVDCVGELTASHDLVLVEGAGGLLVRYDRGGLTLARMAQELRAPVLTVVGAGLGTLNSTALNAEALRARELRSAGIVIGSWPAEPDLAMRCNLADLPLDAGAPLLGALPAGATAEAEGFADRAAAALAPELGGQWDAESFTAAWAAR